MYPKMPKPDPRVLAEQMEDATFNKAPHEAFAHINNGKFPNIAKYVLRTDKRLGKPPTFVLRDDTTDQQARDVLSEVTAQFPHYPLHLAGRRIVVGSVD